MSRLLDEKQEFIKSLYKRGVWDGNVMSLTRLEFHSLTALINTAKKQLSEDDFTKFTRLFDWHLFELKESLVRAEEERPSGYKF